MKDKKLSVRDRLLFFRRERNNFLCYAVLACTFLFINIAVLPNEGITMTSSMLIKSGIGTEVLVMQEPPRAEPGLDEEQLTKCVASLELYLKETRGWESGSYRITYRGEIKERTAARFNISHAIAVLEYYLDAKRGTLKQGTHPMSVQLLVDLVDFSVIENVPGNLLPREKKQQ